MPSTYFKVLSSQMNNPREANYWLQGAIVNGIPIINRNVKEFLLQLEELGARISQSDCSWLNNVCQEFLGRDFKFEGKTSIEIGVGANVSDVDFNVVINKMASWPAQNPRRIYVDCLVNDEEFHYYINLSGKQGRYSKSGNNEYSFQKFIPAECKFLGVKTEKDVLNFRGTKGKNN